MSDSSAALARAFISYAWTDAQYSQRVLELAERLRLDGVDVTIDKWDLQPGHDAFAFMEQMVTDPTMRKVIIVSNSTYAAKANARVGGAGVEAQIISPAIYKSVDQNKFALVAFELGDDGNPYVPAFYGSRIYINLARDVGYEEEYDRLLRWIFEKPLHRKPPLGKPPAHLTEGETNSVSRTRAAFSKAVDAVRQERPTALAAVREFREKAISEFRSKALVSKGAVDFDDRVVESVEEARPLMAELQELTIELARSTLPTTFFDEIINLIEALEALAHRPPDIHQWNEWDFDNFAFLSHEALLSISAVLVKERRFDLLDSLLSHRYVKSWASDVAAYTFDFSAFSHWLRSIEHRNGRLAKNRISLHADILAARYHGAVLTLDDLAAADVLLFLRDCATAMAGTNLRPTWRPITLLLLDLWRPLELFARAESRRVAEQIARTVGVADTVRLRELVQAVIAKGWGPTDGFFGVDLGRLTNVERIGAYP